MAYQRDELDAALHHVTDGIALCRQFVISQPLANGLATLAWIRWARGDAAGALEAMSEAERVADSTVVELLNSVPAQRARLLLCLGDLANCARWTAERGLAADDELTYPREPAYLVLAHVLIAQGRIDPVLGLVDRLYFAATAQRRIGSVIEIRAVQALARAAGGDEAGAVAALTEALTLAQAQRYVRVFVDEGPPMAALLGTLLAAQRTDATNGGDVPVDYLGRLVRAFVQDGASGAAGNAPGRAPIPSLVVQLSERELEVLRLLAGGEQNQEIADQLYLALNTVKKHVTHIFEKLGVANRTEAATRARQLGLLPLTPAPIERDALPPQCNGPEAQNGTPTRRRAENAGSDAGDLSRGRTP